MYSNNLFASIPENLEHEFTELLTQNEKVRIERIVSKGHASPATGWYDQVENEWVIVLQGAAIIAFENGEDVRLERGDYLNIPAHTRHRVKWTQPDSETVWLAIHY
jgi:cupin 2 domain-containing protein